MFCKSICRGDFVTFGDVGVACWYINMFLMYIHSSVEIVPSGGMCHAITRNTHYTGPLFDCDVSCPVSVSRESDGCTPHADQGAWSTGAWPSWCMGCTWTNVQKPLDGSGPVTSHAWKRSTLIGCGRPRGRELGAQTWWRRPSHLSSFVRDVQRTTTWTRSLRPRPNTYREGADMLTQKTPNLRIVPPD